MADKALQPDLSLPPPHSSLTCVLPLPPLFMAHDDRLAGPQICQPRFVLKDFVLTTSSAWSALLQASACTSPTPSIV